MPDNDPKKSDNLSDQLSDFQFGPSWARGGDSEKKDYSSHKGDSRGGNNRDRKEGSRRPEGGKGRQPHKGKGGDSRRRDERRPHRPFVEIPAGINCQLKPCKKAIEAIGQQISNTGHAYPLYTLAQFVLGDRARYIFLFESTEEGPEMIRGKIKPSLTLTKNEALATLWQNELYSEFYDSEEVETEPPAGNFPSVAKCGFSGVFLGPPNHHSYQATVAKLHRERFANMSLDRYKSRIETLSDEESVEQWREQMSKKTVYQTKTQSEGNDIEPIKFETQIEVERHFSENYFDTAFETGKRFIIPGDIPATAVSPGLLELIKRSSSEGRKKPAALIPTLCSILTGQRIAVFKWNGKLHSGPSRPHALPLDAAIADGPAALLDLIGESQGIQLAEVVQKSTGKPSDDPSAEEERKRLLSDLRWLLNEGYALLLEGGQLYVPKKPVKDRPKDEQEAMAKSQATQDKLDSESAKKDESESTDENEST